jgi:phospholipid transport system substrate-binding protein
VRNRLLTTLSLVAIFSVISATFSLADPAPDSPRQMIYEAVDKLNPIVEQGHIYFKEDPDRLYANVNELLETFFDFDAFARGVMGSHFSTASSAQRNNFSTVLQRSLVQTFTDGLINFGTYSVVVLPSVASKQQSKRAKVTMQVTSDTSARHEMIYSLVRGENATWRVRNLVFDGVNIGLSFRSQFANEALNSAGDIEDVINNWQINIDQ